MKNNGRIFAVDDDELIVSMLARSLRKEGHTVEYQISPKGVLAKIIAWQPDIVFLDIDLAEETSGLDLLAELKKEKIAAEVVMLTADNSSESAVTAMKNGAVEYFTKPFNLEEIKIVTANIITNIRRRDEVGYHRRMETPCCFEHGLIGASPAMLTVRDKAEKMARSRVETILITGESGTGKEVLSRRIHNWRQDDPGAPKSIEDASPFFAVNCTALSETLIEDELFGHVKGAFTDAKSDKKGIFELAGDGTLLLDEIGDMRPDLQSKLLRVIEERKVRRLGGQVDLPVEATVIATTNKDLKAAVERGEFRRDLFFRLSAFAIELPPLRERGDDVLLLARYFLKFFAKKIRENAYQLFAA